METVGEEYLEKPSHEILVPFYHVLCHRRILVMLDLNC